MDFKDIEHIITPLLQHYNAARKKMADSDILIIQQIHSHILSQRSKQLRPLLTLLSACLCGLPLDADASHPVFAAAAAIETLHNSSLIHDDVVDNSDLRRGQPSINSQWNNKTAVLMGDYYLAQVMNTINTIDNKLLTRTINDAVTKMCIGELLQQQFSGNYNTNIDDYLRIISLKTATLIDASCQAGAILLDADESTRTTLAQYGNALGVAFQIRDDIHDYLPASLTGKPSGNDIREHKCTLPLIFALKDIRLRNSLMPILEKQNLDDKEIQTIIDTVTDSGSIDYAKSFMHKQFDTASALLHNLPQNKFTSALQKITTLLKEK